jgi:hypothetical protein
MAHNPHVDDYANRILSGLQKDKLPRVLKIEEAMSLAERYGVYGPFPQVETLTLREVAQLLAERLTAAGPSRPRISWSVP